MCVWAWGRPAHPLSLNKLLRLYISLSSIAKNLLQNQHHYREQVHNSVRNGPTLITLAQSKFPPAQKL